MPLNTAIAAKANIAVNVIGPNAIRIGPLKPAVGLGLDTSADGLIMRVFSSTGRPRERGRNPAILLQRLG